MNKKTKTTLMWLPSLLIGCFLTMSALLKLSGFAAIVHQFAQIGLLPYLKLLGTMELVFTAMFLHPRTMRPGFLMLTAYFGGAMAVELATTGQFIVPAAILATTWLGACLRDRAIFFGSSAQHQPLQLS